LWPAHAPQGKAHTIVSAELWAVSVLLIYPIYILLMAGVLRLCGVAKNDVAKWALRQAGPQRFTDLIRAARGLPDEGPDELPGAPTPKRDDDSAAA
jgi:hypothetical protein